MEIKSLLSTKFPLSILDIEALVKGVNYTLRIRCEDTNYYLKIFSTSRDISDICFEISVANALLANGIGVATIVSSICGDTYIKVSLAGEDRLAVLYKDVGGRSLTNNSSDVFLFSKALAELHKTPVDEFLQHTSRIFSIENECCRIRRIIQNTPGIPKTLISKLIENCYSIQIQSLDNCAVLSHGDAWLGNAKYVDGVVYFIDLEDSILANRNFDLGVMAYNLIVRNCEVGENIQALLMGYNNNASMSTTLSAIKPYIQLRSLFVFCFLLENKLVDESLFQKLIERVEYFVGSTFNTEIEHFHD